MIQTHKIGSNTLITDIDEQKKVFAFGITVRAGSFFEKGDTPNGTAHFLEHILFKGYKGTGHLKLTRLFESLGIEINAFTTKTIIHFYIKGLTKHFKKAVIPFLRTLFQPVITEKNVNKEKEIIKEEIISYEDDYEEMIFEDVDKIVFKGSELANPIAGSLKSVDSITKDDLESYHKKSFLSGNIILSFCGGGIDVSFLQDKISEIVPSQETSVIDTGFDTNDIAESQKKDIIASASHIVWVVGIGRVNMDDRIKLSVLNFLLGEGNTSILFWGIREKLGLTYHIYSTLNIYFNQAYLYIYTSLNPEKTKKAERSIENLLSDIISNISEAQLKSAITQIETQLYMESEDISIRMQSNSKDQMVFGRIIDIDEVRKYLNGIKKDDIRKFADLISSSKRTKLIYNAIDS
jgi:predicted Zn-dependent peptidase